MKTRETGAVLGAAMLVAAGFALPTTLSAQEAPMAPWLPFMGCWTDVEAPVDAPLTCVVPAKGGAEILTVASTGVVERQLLRADGVERPFDSGGCTGVQSAEASQGVARIYTQSTLRCEGGTARSTRGIITMVNPREWIDVRALTVEGGSTSWVKRYRLAAEHRVEAAALTEAERAEIEGALAERGLAIETARVAASGPPSVEEIIDAHARTDAEAVRAWIAEQSQPIRLDADRLVRLADAGVSPEVIDVIVAVSYPERFALARQPDAGMERDRRMNDRRYDWDRYRFGSWYYDPFYYDPYYFGRSRFASRYGYGVGGWYGGGWYNGGWSGGPSVIIVQPVEKDRQGRLVKGRGYVGGGSSGGTAAVPRNGSGASSSGGSNAAVGSSSAPAPSASPSPRVKAKPRPPGGGDGGDDG